jgi:hypothetical protein
MLYYTRRNAIPIIDKLQRVIAVLVGRPSDESDESWKANHDSAFQAMTQAREVASFSMEQQNHRRGQFPVLAAGASFGGGQKVRRCRFFVKMGFEQFNLKVPGNLQNSERNKAALALLLGNVAIKRFAGHANGKPA